jgi:hypothetical protein
MFGDQVKFSFKRRFYPFVVACLAVFFVMAGCSRERRPEGVLSEQQMIKALTEIYLLEEKAGRSVGTYDSIKKVFPRMEARLFERMGISDSIFRKSMEYYKADPKKMQYIYTALVDSLQLKVQSAPEEQAQDQ